VNWRGHRHLFSAQQLGNRVAPEHHGQFREEDDEQYGSGGAEACSLAA
jgi:hypothetical protein